MILKNNNNKLKKILILLGILVFILFYNSKSKALGLTYAHDFSIIEAQKNYLTSTGNMQKIIDNRTNEFQWYVWRDETNNRIYYSNRIIANDMNTFYGVVLNDEYANFHYNNIGITLSKYNSNYERRAIIFLSEGDLPYIPNINVDSANSFNQWTMRSNTIIIDTDGLWNSFTIKPNPYVYYLQSGETWSYASSLYYRYDITDGNNNIYFRASQNWNLDLSGTKYSTKSFDLINLTSSLIDFQPTIISNSNIITGYSFRPKFDNFLPNLFKYQYGFGESGYLPIDENEQLISVRGNGSFKVRIIDLSDNSVTYYNYDITDIGTIYDENFDYSITFDTQNNTSGNNIIDNVSIYTMFYPISSFFTYEYQYVLENDVIDDNAWLNVRYNDIDTGLPFTYVANNNGTLYVRIKDKDGTVKIQDSYVVDNIGLFTLGANSSQINTSFDRFRRLINFGSPIGSFIVIPINLMQTLFDSINGTTGVCTNYSLGTLYGHELYFPCVDIKSYLGNDLYSLIDILISCCIIYNLVNMLMEAYYNFISMEKNPIKKVDFIDELRRR